MHRRLGTTDSAGRKIAVGDEVRIARRLRDVRAHPEFKRAFRQVAGRVMAVVGWDDTGGAWIRIGKHELLTVDARLLRVVRPAASAIAVAMPNPSFKRTPRGAA